MNLSEQAIMNMSIGEMFDMIACFAIEAGAKPKNRHKWTMAEVLNLK